MIELEPDVYEVEGCYTDRQGRTFGALPVLCFHCQAPIARGEQCYRARGVPAWSQGAPLVVWCEACAGGRTAAGEAGEAG